MTDRTQPRKTNSSPIARLRMDRSLTQGQLALGKFEYSFGKE